VVRRKIAAAAATGSEARHYLCEGRVWHTRRVPFRHAFDYRVHLLELDLDELGTAFAGNRFWSLDRLNLGSFQCRDHLGGASDLAAAARQAVAQRLGFEPRGRIRLLCHPRYLGYAFNPVTFYLCYGSEAALDRGESPLDRSAASTSAEPAASAVQFSPADHALDAILLEVANTPWNERHLYALDCRGQTSPMTFEIDKAFHVSPFLPMDMRYRFRFEVDREGFRVTKANLKDGEIQFAARMVLQRQPLTRPVLNRMLLQVPPMTLRVITAIYWQALRLWVRGARYHRKPLPATAEDLHG
jgi:DUF1365 family protein